MIEAKRQWRQDEMSEKRGAVISTSRSIAVIERGDRSEDRDGAPFGFARELADTKQDGWDDYMMGVALL